MTWIVIGYRSAIGRRDHARQCDVGFVAAGPRDGGPKDLEAAVP